MLPPSVHPCVRRAVAFVLLSLPGAASLGAQAPTRLVLSTVGEAVETQVAEQVLTEAYRRMGITIVTERFTGDIGIDRANSAMVDGEVLRINGTERTYANLVQVPIPLGYLDVVVYAKDPALRVRGWQDLRTERVGTVRGVMAVDRAIGDLKVRMVDTYPELFSLFAAGEVDVVIVATMDPMLAQRLVPALGAARIAAILDTYLAYHYLHEGRANLIPQLEPILKRMLLDGSIARVRAAVVARALERAR